MLIERICPTCLSYMQIDQLKGWLRCTSCGYMKKEGNSIITLTEILMNRANFLDLPEELQKNGNELLEALNKFRAEFGKPMYVTSGYRSASVNNATEGASKRSSHMSLQACDFRDNGELFEFIKNDPAVLERCGLYMEDPRWSPTWIHLQTRPTSKRIFLPYSDGRAPTAPDRLIEHS